MNKQTVSFKRWGVGGAAAAMVYSASSVWAQTAPPQAASASGDTLEEIVVTAEKRSEDASKVPASITVFSGDKLASEGVVNVDNLQNLTPSLAVTRGPDGAATLTLRGVTTTDFTPKGQPGIAFNIDGIPIQRPIETGNAFFDLERVEVLSGPQGTLYGVSTTGGTVNIITNKPKQTFEAGASLEYGNYDARRGTAYVNVPFSDAFAMRAAGNFNQVDGWLVQSGGGQALNDEDNATGRLTALLKFGESMSITLTGTAGNQEGAGDAQVPYGTLKNESGSAQRTIYSNPFAQSIDDHFQNINAEFDGDFGPVHLTYDGAHLNYRSHDLTSAHTNPDEIGDYNWEEQRHLYETDSHELRLSNATPGTFDWVAGANLLREDIHESLHLWEAPLVDPSYANSVDAINPVNQTTHQSVGGFGQVDWHLTDALTLTAGVRDSDDSTDRVGTFAAGPVAGCVAPADCAGGVNDGHQSANKWTYRGVANYQFAPNQLVYASVASGYKAGGFNDFDPKTGHTAPYAPEEMTAYEIGYKGQPLSNLQFNSSAYYYDYSREQITSLVLFFEPPTPAPVAAVIYTQSVPTTIYGWENTLHWKPTRTDVVDASVVLMKSKYNNYTAGDTAFISSGGAATIGSVNWSGLSLDNTPAFVATLGLTHEFALPNGASLSAHVESKFSSSYVESDPAAASTDDPSNSDSRFTQPSFTRSNATLTYTTSDQRFSLQAFVSNIENKLQMTSGPGGLPANTGLPPTGVGYGTPLSTAQLNAISMNVTSPRFFGLRASVKY